MEIIKLDLNKYLGRSIKVLLTNGRTVRIQVRGIQNIGGKQKIGGYDEEMNYIFIDKADMEMVIE